MKMEQRQDKGVAGLTILLSLVVMLFVIGLLVMIFAIMSGKIMDTDTVYLRTGDTAVKGELLTPTTTGNSSAVASYRDVSCTMVKAYNGTGGAVVNSGNYTFSTGCALSNLTIEFITVPWAINYTYNYLGDGSGAVETINDTASSISSVTDWFDIFIVIGAMVVLILLTVVIITAIRSSGMVAGGEQQQNSVGTA